MNDWIIIAGSISCVIGLIAFAVAAHADFCLIKCENQKGQTDEL